MSVNKKSFKVVIVFFKEVWFHLNNTVLLSRKYMRGKSYVFLLKVLHTIQI